MQSLQHLLLRGARASGAMEQEPFAINLRRDGRVDKTGWSDTMKLQFEAGMGIYILYIYHEAPIQGRHGDVYIYIL